MNNILDDILTSEAKYNLFGFFVSSDVNLNGVVFSDEIVGAYSYS